MNSDERDRLVKTFAYEYVTFNHDSTKLYLVTDVSDDCMLELEGMTGLFAPELFQLAPSPATMTIRKIKQTPDTSVKTR